MTEPSLEHRLGKLILSMTIFSKFQLELPKYSTKEVMKKKLLTAIDNCSTIDLDNDVWQNTTGQRLIRPEEMVWFG